MSKPFAHLDTLDWIVLFATAGALVVGSLPWYTYRAFSLTQSTNGFVTWHGQVFLLTSLATIAVLLLPALQRRLGRRSPSARALVIPALTTASLLCGPILSLLAAPQAFSGVREAYGTQAPILGGNTLWLGIAMIACVAAAGAALAKWRPAAAS